MHLGVALALLSISAGAGQSGSGTGGIQVEVAQRFLYLRHLIKGMTNQRVQFPRLVFLAHKLQRTLVMPELMNMVFTTDNRTDAGTKCQDAAYCAVTTAETTYDIPAMARALSPLCKLVRHRDLPAGWNESELVGYVEIPSNLVPQKDAELMKRISAVRSKQMIVMQGRVVSLPLFTPPDFPGAYEFVLNSFRLQSDLMERTHISHQHLSKLCKGQVEKRIAVHIRSEPDVVRVCNKWRLRYCHTSDDMVAQVTRRFADFMPTSLLHALHGSHIESDPIVALKNLGWCAALSKDLTRTDGLNYLQMSAMDFEFAVHADIFVGSYVSSLSLEVFRMRRELSRAVGKDYPSWAFGLKNLERPRYPR
mmetsp:Transcript_12626/g.23965  ORF Transcript_12626/g.23965 Transcript_12626/m.23965 type:complete len:364 (+) Transcript_12626:51-1142(+)